MTIKAQFADPFAQGHIQAQVAFVLRPILRPTLRIARPSLSENEHSHRRKKCCDNRPGQEEARQHARRQAGHEEGGLNLRHHSRHAEKDEKDRESQFQS